MVNAARGGRRGRPAKRRLVAGCVVASALTVASGCGSASAIAGRAPASPLVTPSSSASGEASGLAPVRLQVLAQYNRFWKVLPAASAASAAQRSALLSAVTTDPELTSLLAAMQRADEQGTVFYGRDLPRASVQELSVAQGVAVVRDCQDSSSAGNADRVTGRRLTVGVARHLVMATMQLGPDGVWRVASVSYQTAAC